MKTLKLFTLFLIITFNSGCYFLENVIPPEWYAEDETNDLLSDIPPEKVVYSEYIWVSHVSGIQCEMMYFRTLQQAINHLRAYGVVVYDQKEYETAVRSVCGSGNGLYFSAKIKSNDLYKLKWSGWSVSIPSGDAYY